MRTDTLRSAYRVFLTGILALAALLPVMVVLAVVLYAGEWVAWYGDLACAFDPLLLGRSILVCALGATLGLLPGVTLALAVSSASRNRARLAIALACGALIVPAYVLTYSWELAFFNLKFLGYLRGFWGCVLLYALATWPVIALGTLGAIRREVAALEDAARMHAGAWRLFCHIKLPLIAPGIAIGWALAFMLSLANSAIPGRMSVVTLSTLIEVRLALDMNTSAAGAYAMPFLMIVLLLFAGLYFLLRRFSFSSGAAFSGRGSLRSAHWLWIPGALGIMLSLGVPLIVLLSVFSFSGLAEVFSSFDHQIISSVVFAALSATLVCASGFWVCAWRRVRNAGSPWQILSISALTFAMSGLMIALGFIAVQGAFRSAGIELVSPAGLWCMVVIGYVVHYFFVGLSGAHLGVSAVDRDLTDAAATLGVGHWKRICGILLPLAARPLAAAWALVFVLVMAETGIAIMLAPPGWQTASVSLHNQLHFDISELTSALSLAFILIGAVPLAIFLLLGPKYAHARSG